MRRITSVCTATIVGGVLTASVVWAQQSTRDDGAERSSGSSRSSGLESVYGASATRGARYLLRNGLDYLEYQQYERALKFLREAETREKELSSAEKLSLKRGIERAQRGLRESADAETPYAISDRGRRTGRFRASKPEENVASGGKAGRIRQESPQVAGSGGTRQDDWVGQGSGLSSGTPVARIEPQATAIAQTTGSSTDAATDRAVASASNSGRPAELLEIPKLPPIDDIDPSVKSAPVAFTGRSADDQIAKAAVQNPQPPALGPAVASPTGDNAAQSQAMMTPAPVPGAAPSTQGMTRLDSPPPTVIELETVPSNNPTAASSAAPASSASAAPAPASSAAPAPASSAAPAPAASAAPELDLAPEDSPAIAEPPSPQSSVAARSSAVAQSSKPLTAPAAEQTAGKVPAVGSSPASQTQPAEQAERKEDTSELPPLPAEPAQTAAASSTPPESGVMSAPADGSKPAPSPSAELVEQPSPSPVQKSSASTEPAAAVPGASALLVEEPAKTPAPEGAMDLPELPADLSEAPGSVQAQSGLVQDSSAIQADPAGGVLSEPAVHTDPAPSPVQGATAADPARGVASDESLPELPAVITTAPVRTSQAGGRANSQQTPSADTVSLTAASPTGDTPSAQPPAQADPVPTELPALPASGASTNSGAVRDDGPAAEAPPGSIVTRHAATELGSIIPRRGNAQSTLRPELQREVERIARIQDEMAQRRGELQPSPRPDRDDNNNTDLRTQSQIDISRASSPAQARPIKAIPVPDDWVPLGPRTWSPQHKFWAAAATCHLPLYFQDPVLERYGHSVEQFVGPIGRYLSYPVDDPTQSTQKNQMIQPFFSAGLMALQIVALPYNLVMDPPWEAQYDLGYYRPGDDIPTDLYWLPLHGYGPPLRGDRY